MYKYILILAVIFMTSVGNTFAHGGSIEGTITNSKNNKAISFVSVQIEGLRIGGITDTNGMYMIIHIPEGKHTLIVSAIGYRSQTQTVDIIEGGTETFDFEIKQTPLQSKGMVVTGTRTPRYIKDVPVRTEVITNSSIENKSAHNIFEALDGELGVKVEQQCQGCNFSVLRMQGLGADHTQILIDGQPVYSGLASVYGLQQMSTVDIDQIEIVKGAGSALYGSSAVAGAINIISMVPQETEAKVGIEIGEHNTNMYNVFASTRKNNIGTVLYAQQNNTGEIDETGDINAIEGVDNPDGWLDRARSNSKNAGFKLFFDNLIGLDKLIIRGSVMNELRQGGWLKDNLFENPFAPGTERIITDRYSAQINYQTMFSAGNEINASLSVINHKRDATNDTFLSDYEDIRGESAPIDLLRPYIAKENLLVLNFNYLHPLGNKHNILTGIQFTHNDLEESGMYLDVDSEEPYVSTSTKKANEIGIYLQDEFRIHNRLELVGGLRFDYHSSEDNFRGSGDVFPQGLAPLEYEEKTINPRFAIKYNITEDFSLRGSIGSGYRVPYGFSEDLHLCSGSPRVYKGGNLKPEKSLSYSTTADYTGINWNASINLYQTELEDAIAFAEADDEISALGYSYQWQNIDNAYVRGMDIAGSYAITNDFVFSLRLEYFDGKYDNARSDWVGTEFEEISRNISRYPKYSGGVNLEFSPSTWGFNFDADYKGKMFIDLTEPADPANIKIHETEPFVIINTKISKNFFDNYQLYIGARNLNGYTQEKKHIDDAAFMYAPVYGRIIYGGIKITL